MEKHIDTNISRVIPSQRQYRLEQHMPETILITSVFIPSQRDSQFYFVHIYFSSQVNYFYEHGPREYGPGLYVY